MKTITMQTFHLWGAHNEPNEISPESIALYWYLKDRYQNCSDDEVEIVYSNNTDLSPCDRLPLLIISNGVEDIKKVSGFDNIVLYFVSGDKDDTIEDSQLYANALLEFATSAVCPLTLYQLYLNKKNYSKFTRKQFSKLLYWPMWYNVPLAYRASARDQCDKKLNLGYLTHEDDPEYVDLGTDDDATDLAQSKVFKLKAKSASKNKDELEQAKHNLQYLNKLAETVKEWYSVRFEKLPKGDAIPADILFLANMHIQLGLPDGDKVTERLFEVLGTEKMTILKEQINQYVTIKSNLKTRSPSFKEQGNVIMSVYHKGTRYL